ncbi:MAG: hypothetical protein V3R99_09480 [Thermoguttaceae bacterium]
MPNPWETPRLGACPLFPRDQHTSLVHKMMLLAGWVQVGGMVGMPLVLLAGVWYWRRRRRRKSNA